MVSLRGLLSHTVNFEKSGEQPHKLFEWPLPLLQPGIKARIHAATLRAVLHAILLTRGWADAVERRNIDGAANQDVFVQRQTRLQVKVDCCVTPKQSLLQVEVILVLSSPSLREVFCATIAGVDERCNLGIVRKIARNVV